MSDEARLPKTRRRARVGVAALLDDASQADTVTIPIKLCNLPPFHAIAHQILWLRESPEVDVRKITSIVSSDPALAAEVLFLANSSLFGFPSRIQVLQHAVALLGLDRVKALAMTVATRALLGKGGPVVDRCWRHSTASAVIASQIAPSFDIAGDAAYTAALLHDIGRLGFIKTYEREYTLLLSSEHDDSEQLLAAEREVFQVDHGVAGGWLVGYWAFPAAFTGVCEYHHDPLHQADSPILRTVKVACGLADALGYSAAHYHHVLGHQHWCDVLPPHTLPPMEKLRHQVELRLAALDA